MTTANRGKKAEKKVADFLSGMSSKIAAFDWHRQYDARSAGGRFPAQPGDFAFYSPSAHGLIEVKEVEHDFRLPKKNFDEDQIAKLYKRTLAGGHICVLVNFTTTKQWVSPPLQFFRDNLGKPSWDLSEFTHYPTAEAALTIFFTTDIS